MLHYGVPSMVTSCYPYIHHFTSKGMPDNHHFWLKDRTQMIQGDGAVSAQLQIPTWTEADHWMS